MGIAERFWSHVDRSAGESACWPWTASRRLNGYGQFGVTRARVVSAHRLAWELTRGAIPHGAVVMHACDNRLCCNPAHLSLGANNRVNMADMVAKDRGRGARRHIDADTVKRLRELVASGMTGSEAAKLCGISQPHASCLVRRVSRAGVGP